MRKGGSLGERIMPIVTAVILIWQADKCMAQISSLSADILPACMQYLHRLVSNHAERAVQPVIAIKADLGMFSLLFEHLATPLLPFDAFAHFEKAGAIAVCP